MGAGRLLPRRARGKPVGPRKEQHRCRITTKRIAFPGIEVKAIFIGLVILFTIRLVDKSQISEARCPVPRIEHTKEIDGNGHGQMAGNDRNLAKELLISPGPMDPCVPA